MIGCPHCWIVLNNFSRILFTTFFGITLENCVCFWGIFTFLYFFSTFSRFLTQVYIPQFFTFLFFSPVFSIFVASAFLQTSLILSRKCYLWLQLNSCIHFWRFDRFLQLSCVIIFGIEEVVALDICCTSIYYFTYIVSVFDTTIDIFTFCYFSQF